MPDEPEMLRQNRNGRAKRTPEQVMAGDTTEKTGPGTDTPEGSSTEPGNPGGYPVHGDPGSRGY